MFFLLTGYFLYREGRGEIPISRELNREPRVIILASVSTEMTLASLIAQVVAEE